MLSISSLAPASSNLSRALYYRLSEALVAVKCRALTRICRDDYLVTLYPVSVQQPPAASCFAHTQRVRLHKTSAGHGMEGLLPSQQQNDVTFEIDCAGVTMLKESYHAFVAFKFEILSWSTEPLRCDVMDGSLLACMSFASCPSAIQHPSVNRLAGRW
jgi:hypothetical protein